MVKIVESIELEMKHKLQIFNRMYRGSINNTPKILSRPFTATRNVRTALAGSMKKIHTISHNLKSYNTTVKDLSALILLSTIPSNTCRET